MKINFELCKNCDEVNFLVFGGVIFLFFCNRCGTFLIKDLKPTTTDVSASKIKNLDDNLIEELSNHEAEIKVEEGASIQNCPFLLEMTVEQ